jgi:hypothetical protein
MAELGSVARREYAIVLAAVPPVIAVMLGAAGVVSQPASLWLAFGSGVITLTAQGFRYAKLERLGLLGTLFTVTLNVVLGLSIVAFEVLIAH